VPLDLLSAMMTVNAPRGTRPWFNIYFAGRLIHSKVTANAYSEGSPAITDRLGSVRRGAAYAMQRATYYPFGEKRPESNFNLNLDVSNQTAFGTYQRDVGYGGTLDYAMNRYYAPQWGRFTTPDPYQASAQLANPQSWNRYSYVENDPVNGYDPTGELMAPVEDGGGGGGRVFVIPGLVFSVWKWLFGGTPRSPLLDAWRTNPQAQVAAWDRRIAEAQDKGEEKGGRYPHHLRLTEDCYETWKMGGSVVRRRTYELEDQNDTLMAGAVRITETNYVVQGNLGGHGSTWTTARVVDLISIGSGPVTTQYQQFTAQVVSGIDIMAAPVPVMVRDPVRGDFGTLGIKMEKDVIFIKCDDGKVEGQYRWCP
jgi:RHS repeat-associated protein